jgi:prepilin-type N-terminal cleavage/methylation domain-containing protein
MISYPRPAMKHFPDRIKRNLGFTIPETLIVMAIVAAVTTALWRVTTSVAMKHDEIEAIDDLQTIEVAFAGLFNHTGVAVDTGDGWPDITCMGLNEHIIPGDMVQKGSACKNNIMEPPLVTPWCSGKWPTLCFSVRGDQARQGIIISYWNLPKAACVAMASSQANTPVIIQSFVGNTDSPNNKIYPPFGSDKPMTLLQIADYCGRSGNEVTFEYAIR